MFSDGRLEFGIGAGYYQPEYSQTGITLPTPRDRVDQLREALAVIKVLWSVGPFTFTGKHYTITDMEGWPKPLRRPHPPIQVGGGGKRMLTLAASRIALRCSGPGSRMARSLRTSSIRLMGLSGVVSVMVMA